MGARRKVRAENPRVVAVTGTVGKTSAKEAIALVLAESGRPVVKTAGNLGTDLGVALSLLGFHDQPGGAGEWLKALWRALFPPIIAYKEQPYYVLEYAADMPGDIAYLCGQIQPDVAAVTRITPAHMANYRSLDELAVEKLTIFRMASDRGYLVINEDDPYQVAFRALKLKEGFAAERIIGYSQDTAFSEGVHRDKAGLAAPLAGGEVVTQVYAAHQLYSLQLAAAIGLQEGIPAKKVAAALSRYELPPGRGRVLEGREGITILDESYNASPAAVVAALEGLRGFAGRRRVAILGNMNELGDSTEMAHAHVGEEAGNCVDVLVVAGPQAERMAAASRLGAKAIAFATPEDLLDHLDEVVLPGDVILVKGSQNRVRLERVVKKLLAHPEDAPNLLVRQEPYWQR